MISVLAIDLDDTLVRSDKTISARTLDALKAWEERQNRIVIATGRPPRMTRSIPDVLHHLPWICYNGAVIHENYEAIYEDLISAADTYCIVERLLAQAPACRIGLEIDDTLYLNQPLDRPGARHVPDLLAVADQPAAKVLFALDQFGPLDGLADLLPNSTKLLVSEKYNLVQIMPHTSSKAQALAHLVRGWGRTLDDVMAFGDDTNDVEMVQESGVGVAMANAVPEVKAVADRITRTNDEDGVAIVLEELLARQQMAGDA